MVNGGGFGFDGIGEGLGYRIALVARISIIGSVCSENQILQYACFEPYRF
jgi:hypothetical protein